MNDDYAPEKIGLALSGGGTRAAIFHLGVLLRLANEKLLERVSHLSTVSGGSLITGLIMTKSDLCWPTSNAFLRNVYPEVRQLMTTKDLFSFKAVGLQGILRYNLGLITNRAGILADLLKQQWGFCGELTDLPDWPQWTINTTCIETGKNWRFSKREMGDWKFGKHFEPSISIAEAAAASAAVPYIIGALKMNLPSDGWYRTNPATRELQEKIKPASNQVSLWDGGAYENLGLEAIFKPQQPLKNCDILFCSDASGFLNLPSGNILLSLIKGQLKAPRLFDISSDQIRALRARMFMQAIAANNIKGILFRMGNSVRNFDIKAEVKRVSTDYDLYQNENDVASSFSYPTGLTAVSEADFDRIARHGFENADVTMTTYLPSYFKRSFFWNNNYGNKSS